ncbi:retrotransposon protein, putative, ty1-copia subclass [Tanacetum coccineum]
MLRADLILRFFVRSIRVTSHIVLGIAPVAIIDRQLPFEYTITSRSTDVVVMALPVQNINHSAFRSMFKREKLSGNNFNDWFRQLKLVLRVEKKMYVIEQPLPAAPAANSEANVLLEWNAIYDAYNEVACLILGSMTPELHRQFENSSPYDMIKELKAMFEKQAGVERFDLIQTFHACKQEEGKPVAAYVIQMKGYVDQLERLGYMLPQDLVVGLILNGLTKDFAGFVRNYNMHNMGKYELVELCSCSLIMERGFREAKKLKQGALYLYVGNGVRAQVEAIGSYDLVFPNGLVICLDNCYYAPSILRGVVSVHRLVENGFVQRFTDFGILVSKNNVHYFNAIPSNGIYEIDMHNLVPNVNSIYNVSTKRAKHNLDSTYLWHCRLAHISKKRIEKLQQEGLLKSTDDESFDQCVSCLLGKMTRKSFPHRPERATDLLGIIHTDVCGPLRHVSRQVENQLGKTIKALRSDRGGEYISQEFKDYLKACGIVQQLTPPYTPQHNGVSERRNRTLLDMVRSMMNLTTLPLSFWDYALESATRILNMVPTKKGCEALVKRDTPDKLQQRSVKCIFIGYPKETMGYYFYFPPENKIVVASEIPMKVGFEPSQEEVIPILRSARTHQALDRLCLNVEVEEHSLGDLNEPTNYKAAILDSESDKWTVGSKWVLKKKTDMDGNVHTYKARLVAKGFTQTYGVDYEETFSPVANIRAIRIVIAIAVFYDYEIWQMDVKTAFLNGYLDEDIYMVQPEGFIDPNHPRKVCKLQRSIYGLKQASRSWNKRFDEEIKRMDNSKRGNIPMQEKFNLNKTQGASTPEELKRMQNVPYASPISGELHWTAMKTILKYLRNTKDMFLVYGGNPKAELRVDCYCDAGFETDRDDIKS